MLGNPHSANPSSSDATALVEGARRAVLNYFNAGDRYTAIFTLAQRGGALKLIGEKLSVHRRQSSADGIRQSQLGERHSRVCEAKGAAFNHAPLTTPDLRLIWRRSVPLLGAANREAANLFVSLHSRTSPACSIRSVWSTRHAAPVGVSCWTRHSSPRTASISASWEPRLRHDLVLQDVRLPHRRRLSPGAQRRPAAAEAAVVRGWHGELRDRAGTGAYSFSRRRGFEDGTLNYLAIPAVQIGLQHLERIGIDRYSHARQRAGRMAARSFLALRHSNGRHMVRDLRPGVI